MFLRKLKVAKKKLKLRYSGKRSEKFWKLVDKLGNTELYKLATDLQDIEGRVFESIVSTRKNQTAKKKAVSKTEKKAVPKKIIAKKTAKKKKK